VFPGAVPVTKRCKRTASTTLSDTAMADELTFHELILRVRMGDEPAAALLVQRYEPAIRRAVRFRLTDPRLRRTCDSLDVCQSVLASFFVRLALGQYEFETPEDLIRLLGSMARNKIVDKGRRVEREGQADQRVPLAELPETALASREGTPSQKLVVQELIQEARRRLSPEERQLLEWREQGLEWDDIAGRVGDPPETLRKRLARASALVARQLGLAEDDDD
jgi:RNA polymerase sigma factor (sigma-70 family)